jgi:GT2 family glycosyltransferase
MKKVAIVISTYNQRELLKQSLNSLKKTNYDNYKIFVVDDSGKGIIGKEIKEKFTDVRVLINSKNKGFSGGYNEGIRLATKEYHPDYVLVLNDDIEIIDKSWLKKLIEIGEKREDVGIIGCKILYPDKTLQNMGGFIRGWKIDSLYDSYAMLPFNVDYVMGAFMLIKREVIKDIGLLDEIFNPYLLEDTDYCLRAKKVGWDILSVPAVKIIHKKGKSIDSSTDEPKRLLVRFKNDIIFSKRHLSGWNKFFRIFVYLPIVAVFRKDNDTDKLQLRNFILRKNPFKNLWMWFIAFWPSLYKEKIK